MPLPVTTLLQWLACLIHNGMYWSSLLPLSLFNFLKLSSCLFRLKCFITAISASDYFSLSLFTAFLNCLHKATYFFCLSTLVCWFCHLTKGNLFSLLASACHTPTCTHTHIPCAHAHTHTHSVHICWTRFYSV